MHQPGYRGAVVLTNDTRYSNRGDTTSQEALINARSEKVTSLELQPAINTLLQWTDELNRGPVDRENAPYFKFVYEYDPTFEETINALSQRVPMSAKWFYEKFNMAPPENEDDQLVEQFLPTAGGTEGLASNKDFFLHSEQPPKEPPVIKQISRSLKTITAR